MTTSTAAPAATPTAERHALILFIVGTPQGFWSGDLVGLLTASSLGGRVATVAAGSSSGLAALIPGDAGEAPWAGVDADGCWAVDALALQQPRAQWLVVVEHPALGLAEALAGDVTVDAAAWLARWCAASQRLLRHAQRDPARSLLVDADDVRQDPAAFAALCGSRFGITWAATTAIGARDTDPLARALAEALVHAQPQAGAAFAELQASCALLLPDAPPPPSLAERIDAAAATRRLHDLRSAGGKAALESQQTQLRTAQAERDAQATLASALQAELQRLQQEHDAAVDRTQREATELRAAAAQAQSGRAAAERSLQALSQERQLFALQVNQLHDELAQRWRLAEAREAQMAQLDAALVSQSQVVAALQGEVSRHTAAVDAVRRGSAAALNDLEAQHARERNELRTRVESAQRQRIDLEELVAAGAPFVQHIRLEVGSMTVTSERPDSPYRDLAVTLRDLHFGERHATQLALRLVEHHGHPGLALFDAAARQVLSSWHESGRENERPYLLLIPGDSSSQPAFDAMGSVDWLLLQALVAELTRQLRQSRSDLRTRSLWLHLARRLQGRLHDLPSRLRHDGCIAEAPPQAPSGTLTLRLQRVQWAARLQQQLVVHWRHAGPQACITVEGDTANGLLPLDAWPVAEDGSLLQRASLPLGREADAGAKHAAWSALSQNDRGFLLALLAELPELAAAASPRDADVTAAAADALRDAVRATEASAPQPTGRLRRVAQRLRHGAVPA